MEFALCSGSSCGCEVKFNELSVPRRATFPVTYSTMSPLQLVLHVASCKANHPLQTFEFITIMTPNKN